jgi:hypothetical protein
MTNKNIFANTRANTNIAINKGWDFLKTQNKNGFYQCFIGSSRNISESYLSPPETSNMLIVEALLKYHPDNNLTVDAIDYLYKQSENHELFTYFEDYNLYPPDSDVNAVGYSILYESGRIDKNKSDKIFSVLSSNINTEGIPQVWITDDDRPKNIDHVVVANILYFAYLLGREKEIIQSENWIYNTLQTSEYLNGSRYYNSPDAFLFAINRIANKFPMFKKRFKKSLYESINNRIKKAEHPLDIAMTIIVAKSFDINTKSYKNKLINLQNSNGSWPADALFRFGSVEKYFGSQALSTAYAIRALEL